jgi:uncharacterized repeat protein (TIGR01451 family)
MNRHFPFLSLLVLVSFLAAARADMQPRPLPMHGPAPLLFVRFNGVPGMRVTFFQGRAAPRELPAPAVVGMRPGYRYRVELSRLPEHPGVSLFPTLEVVGSLHLPARADARNFPAPVTLTTQDIETALRGGLVTKVVYLEHPDRSVPSATTPTRFIEIDRPPNRDLLGEARDAGRVMLVFRLGQRGFTREELMAESVFGTILYPDERVLARPRVPPHIAWTPWPPYDPVLGPRPPEEEFLHDGGDRGVRAGPVADGGVGGLDPEDTVAEYADSHGRRHVTHSNRVCLLVPRFVILRKQVDLDFADRVESPEITWLARNEKEMDLRLPARATRQGQHLAKLRGRERPSENLNAQKPGALVQVKVLDAQEMFLGLIEVLGTKRAQLLTGEQRLVLRKKLQFTQEITRLEGPREYLQEQAAEVVGVVKGGAQVIRAEAETRDLTVCCHEVPRPPEKPLVLVKCADRDSARPGDVVTFSLKYSNLGGRPITDVAVSDSLSPRLEYVAGSAQSDRNAVFTTQPNGAGSLILHWEISGVLQPGQSGRIRFQARVR